MRAIPHVCRPHRAIALVAAISLGSLACSGRTSNGGPHDAAAGGAGVTGAGGRGNPVGGVGSAGEATGDVLTGGPKLRLLTQAEYKNALADLLGELSAPLDLPPDTFLGGFSAIGASEVAVNAPTAAQYEAASRAASAEVFADTARWQKLVGCQPKADLSDACVTSFIKRFGKRAFRRDLTDGEVQEWLQVGIDGVQLSASPEQSLATVTSGLLQSPYFLYRVETNKLDTTSGRLKYDGASMATRLAFLLTGHPPSDALLKAAAAGQLDTTEGVRAAAAPLLTDPSSVDRMAVFFSELSQANLVLEAPKSPDLFPGFDADLRSSMLQATQLFIKNIVLVPDADVRTLFDSDQTFVDATLASFYGVSAPASGFGQIKLGPETGRAGILGQAGVLAGHSFADHTSPSHRGLFISEAFLCRRPPVSPAGVSMAEPVDPTLTTRQKLAQHASNPTCAACHTLFDPLGLALEHFDAIGKYRETENGLAIDATGSLDGVAFDGAVGLGGVLRQSTVATSCLMSNFYRNANGVVDAAADSVQIDSLSQTLASKGYVWRDLVAEFVVSDAFRSAPAAAVTAGNQ